MPFRGLTMLKSPKLIIKGGLCYGFAMVTGLGSTESPPPQGLLLAEAGLEPDDGHRHHHFHFHTCFGLVAIK